MENLTLSKYTYLFKTKNIENIEHLIYNSRSNAFLRISRYLYDILIQSKENPVLKTELISDIDIKVLTDSKVLVPPNEDESFIKDFEMKTHFESFSSSHLSLSLAPTSACNFRCPYCYERNKPNKVMSDETIDNLITFINEHKHIKTIGITWYGGEPLVAFNTIKKIIEKINKECSAKLIAQEIVTNGYNFNNDVIDFFQEKKLSRIQITIDGPEYLHNKTRILSNGKGTYKKILSNIENILERLPQTHLSIRVNIGKDNQEGYSILYKELTDKFKGNFSIYPGFIRINNENKTSLSCGSMEQKDIIDFYEKMKKDNIAKIRYYPSICKSKGCVATISTSYVIGPSGEMYKCWNDMGEKNMIVGYIHNKKLTNAELFNQYMIDGRWTSDSECKSCFFLPICDGGCAWQRVRNKYYGGNYNFCCLYKENGIEQFLQIQYKRWKKKKREPEVDR